MWRPTCASHEGLFPRYLSDAAGDHHNLFAYPAQSNFSGVQHPLEWIAQAHARGWDVLLDCGRVRADQPARPGRWQPDFVAVSFYKMFG